MSACKSDIDCPSPLICLAGSKLLDSPSAGEVLHADQCGCNVWLGYKNAPECTEFDVGATFQVGFFATQLFVAAVLAGVLGHTIGSVAYHGKFKRDSMNYTLCLVLMACVVWVIRSLLQILNVVEREYVFVLEERVGRYLMAERALLLLSGFAMALASLCMCLMWIDVAASSKSFRRATSDSENVLSRYRKLVGASAVVITIPTALLFALGWFELMFIVYAPFVIAVCSVYVLAMRAMGKLVQDQMSAINGNNSSTSSDKIARAMRDIKITVAGFCAAACGFAIFGGVWTIARQSEDKWQSHFEPGRVSILIWPLQGVDFSMLCMYVFLLRYARRTALRKVRKATGATSKSSHTGTTGGESSATGTAAVMPFSGASPDDDADADEQAPTDKRLENMQKRKTRPRNASMNIMAPVDMPKFIAFCESRHASESPAFYNAVVEYEKIGRNEIEKLREEGKSIVEKFVAVGSPQEVTLDQRVRDAVVALIESGDFKPDSFDPSKREVVQTMMSDLYPQYREAHPRE